MRYVMFVCMDEEATAEDSAAAPDLDSWFEYVRSKNAFVHAIHLEPREQAKTVRNRGGELLVTDGPFSESREWIAGYALLECDSLDDAIDIAARNPTAYNGRLEVGPVQSSTLDD